MGLFNKRVGMKQYREFKKIFSMIKKIDQQSTLEEVDMVAGFFLGVVSEKEESRKITAGQKETLADMIEAIHENRRKQLERDEEPAQSFTKLWEKYGSEDHPGFIKPAGGKA